MWITPLCSCCTAELERASYLMKFVSLFLLFSEKLLWNCIALNLCCTKRCTNTRDSPRCGFEWNMRLQVFGHVTTTQHTCRRHAALGLTASSHVPHSVVSSCFSEGDRCPQPIRLPALHLQPGPGKTALTQLNETVMSSVWSAQSSDVRHRCVMCFIICSVRHQPIRRQRCPSLPFVKATVHPKIAIDYSRSLQTCVTDFLPCSTKEDIAGNQTTSDPTDFHSVIFSFWVSLIEIIQVWPSWWRVGDDDADF